MVERVQKFVGRYEVPGGLNNKKSRYYPACTIAFSGSLPLYRKPTVIPYPPFDQKWPPVIR